MVINALTSLGRPPTHSRLQLISCGVMVGDLWPATSLEAIISLDSMLGRITWPAALPSKPPILRPHRPDAPRIQLRLYGHLPTAAGRTDEPFPGRRDGRIHRQAETGWRTSRSRPRALQYTQASLPPRSRSARVTGFGASVIVRHRTGEQCAPFTWTGRAPASGPQGIGGPGGGCYSLRA